ncbi:MAG TPA: cysteine peptidase family C39 domain-containing protein [Patescibacteria group bacterium]|nr:cysteine peptidase family C39 domain-containing protein [Patescibacteria group bacterium]
MQEPQIKHIPLSGTAAEQFFQRQLDDHSCGPACLATVAKIYGSTASYSEVRELLAPDPRTGTPQEVLAFQASKFAPQADFGAHTYNGGVAIANIMQEGEGHYVVFLAREGDLVLYYEPYYHEFVIAPLASIVWDDGNWEPGSARESHWTVNFTALPDDSFEKWLSLAEQKLPPPPKQSFTQPRP